MRHLTRKSFMFSKRHTLVFLVLATLFGLVVSVSGQSGRVQPTPTPDDTIRVVTEEIKLNVLAFDERDNFFPGVEARDIVITDDDILHQPTSVRFVPANILIVMDTGGEMRSVKTLDWTRKVARGVIASLRPEDSIALIQYSETAEVVSEWTNDRNAINEAVKRTNFGRKSAFAAALKIAAQLFDRNSLDNKHLVLITDGTDSSVSIDQVGIELQKFLATDITVHVLSYTSMESVDIAPRTSMISNTPPRSAMPDMVKDQLPKGGPQEAAKQPKIGPTINLDRTLLKKIKARKADLETSQAQLEKVVENTNGVFVLPESTDEMVEKASLVARMIDSSYVVTYTPKNPVIETRGIATRNIEVTSKRPGLIVQARRKLIFNAGTETRTK
ncbi:MAG: VWA domain-containing protein [Acidobacteria bacterium]|nr:VWA domain-containing protein [Acidobacteriota bacterium]